MEVTRTRFAPSPTGALHAGSIRTALFAWLIARQNNGQFLLRIEDTDQARSIEGGVKNITESLEFIGLNWDEGPGKPAEDGPFIQSERLDKYQDFAKQLISKGRAYADPYSKEELDELRSQAKAEHKPFLYRDHRPENPPAWDGSRPLRLKSEPKDYSWNDLVMGDLSTGPEAIDDFILIKSDGFPTYNFAHIVDDHLMHITHVIRSQEFISSMPNFLNLYDALDIKRPLFITPPPVLNETGKKKLSKRDGAKQVLDYKDMGILPEAFVNFLATLGWNDGTTQEIFSMSELIEKFDPRRMQRSGAQFNEGHLIYLNGVYIRKLPLDELFERVASFWPKSSSDYDESYKKNVLRLVQERLKFFSELSELTKFFFEELPIDNSLISNNKYLGGIDRNELKNMLIRSRDELETSDFSSADLTNKLNGLLAQLNQKPGVLFSLIRIATTQAPASPGLAETLEVLGRNTSITRINKMIDSL